MPCQTCKKRKGCLDRIIYDEYEVWACAWCKAEYVGPSMKCRSNSGKVICAECKDREDNVFSRNEIYNG